MNWINWSINFLTCKTRRKCGFAPVGRMFTKLSSEVVCEQFFLFIYIHEIFLALNLQFRSFKESLFKRRVTMATEVKDDCREYFDKLEFCLIIIISCFGICNPLGFSAAAFNTKNKNFAHGEVDVYCVFEDKFPRNAVLQFIQSDSIPVVRH